MIVSPAYAQFVRYLTRRPISKMPRTSPDCPRGTVQFHLNLPAAESVETFSTIHSFDKMDSATPTDGTDESMGGKGVPNDVMGTALSLLVDDIIRRAFDVGLAKRAEESSKRQQDPFPTTATILNPTSGPAQTAEQQEVKRWMELLELEDEVRQMAKRVTERERAIGERERRVSEQEDAMRMSSNGDGISGIEDKKRAGSWVWW